MSACLMISLITIDNFAALFYCTLVDRASDCHSTLHSRDLDNAVVKALACHRCDPGSNPGVSMWQGKGRPSKVGGFPRGLRFPPPRMTTERHHPRLRERVFKFYELSV